MPGRRRGPASRATRAAAPSSRPRPARTVARRRPRARNGTGSPGCPCPRRSGRPRTRSRPSANRLSVRMIAPVAGSHQEVAPPIEPTRLPAGETPRNMTSAGKVTWPIGCRLVAPTALTVVPVRVYRTALSGEKPRTVPGERRIEGDLSARGRIEHREARSKSAHRGLGRLADRHMASIGRSRKPEQRPIVHLDIVATVCPVAGSRSSSRALGGEFPT